MVLVLTFPLAAGKNKSTRGVCC